VAFTQEQEGHHRPLAQETVEVWRYRVEDLPRLTQEALEDRTEVELTFRVHDGKVELLDGKWVLEAAARATILRGRD
jgi:hypothetical protein